MCVNWLTDTFSYLPCMLRAGVFAGRSLQDGALLTAAIWGVLVGLHLRVAAWWGWTSEHTPYSTRQPGEGAGCSGTRFPTVCLCGRFSKLLVSHFIPLCVWEEQAKTFKQTPYDDLWHEVDLGMSMAFAVCLCSQEEGLNITHTPVWSLQSNLRD